MSTIASTVSPVGFGITAPSALAPPSPLLADNIDPTTNDYVSLTVGVDPIDAAVVNAVKIVRGSGAAVVSDGARFYKITKITNSIEKEIESIVLEALLRLIRNRDIEYKGVDFLQMDPSTQTVEIAVKWVNLRALDGRIRTSTVGVNL